MKSKVQEFSEFLEDHKLSSEFFSEKIVIPCPSWYGIN